MRREQEGEREREEREKRERENACLGLKAFERQHLQPEFTSTSPLPPFSNVQNQFIALKNWQDVTPEAEVLEYLQQLYS